MKTWFACAICLVPCIMNAAETTTPLQDARFVQPHDKDHPWDFKQAYSDRAAWEKRAEFLRHQVMVSQGLWPMPAKTPLGAVIHGRIERDAYTIEKVFFASMPGHYVSGNLYRPIGKTGKLAAVLCPYGHWPDGRFVWKNDAAVKKEIDSGAEIDPIAAKTPLQANCAMLARMGCVVFQYDLVGYCDSTKIPHREGFLDAEAILRAQSFMGLQTWNSIRAMDFVLSLPDVDPERIAVTGSSSGASQAIALNAVDTRAAVAFPMVMVSMNMQGGCVCENAPLYRVMTNNVELASLFAPKPQGMAAANDWTIDFMTRGLPEMKSIWGLYAAQDQVAGQHFNFPHNHNLPSREMQYSFLNRQLRLGWPEPVKEKPFEPVPPKELSVYDDAHARPADEADAKTLRDQMTRASDQALAAMPAAERARVVRIALGAMLVDQMPGANDVESIGGDFKPLSKAGTKITFISRKGAGERVPCKMIYPANWNGSIVIWANPSGCSGLSMDDESIRKLTDRGSAVMAIDWFMSDGFRPLPKTVASATTKANPNPPYAAYTIGYDRSIIAQRVHDLLTAIAVAGSINGGGPVRLIGIKEAGPVALLARAIADDAVTRAVIDLNEFDFDQIKSDNDPMLLPGALKYGGIFGFVPLCHSGQTLLCNAPASAGADRGARTEGVTIEHGSRDAGSMVRWMMDSN